MITISGLVAAHEGELTLLAGRGGCDRLIT